MIGVSFFFLQQDNDPELQTMEKLFLEEAVSWQSVCNRVARTVKGS